MMREIQENILNFLVILRQENRFDIELWKTVEKDLSQQTNGWKKSGNVPKGIVPYLLDLVSALSGGSRFWNEQTYEKAEDAEIKLLEMFYELYDQEYNHTNYNG